MLALPYLLPAVAAMRKRGLRALLVALTALSALAKLGYSYDLGAWGLLEGMTAVRAHPNLLLWNITRFHPFYALLEVLMGVAAALVAVAHGAWGRGPALGAFAAQLVVNLAWAPLFFGAHRIGLAFALQLVLDALVAVCIVFFARVRPLAAWLMAPYLVWGLFATVLCWQVLSLNPWADGAAGPPAALRLRIGP